MAVAGTAMVLVGVFGPVRAETVVDWQAGRGDDAQGWVLERFGTPRVAELRMERAGDGPAAQARLASADANPPTASLRFPVPFRAQHTYRVDIELSSPSGARADVLVRRRAAPYDPMAIRSVALDGRWTTVELEATWPAGAAEGDVRVQIRDPEGRIAVRRLKVADLGVAPLGTIPSAPFAPTLIGLHVNKLGRHMTWPEAGQSLVRLWDTGTTWNNLAPTARDFDDSRGTGWKRLDAYVDYALRHRPDATLLYTLGMPPPWASSDPDAKCAYGPGTCGAPASMQTWRHYVRTLAQRYRGRIRYWELWNEADYLIFYTRRVSLVELARAASEELKAVDPQNRLLSPGFTNSGGLNALHTFLRDGGGRYIDIVGFHWYFDGQPERLAVPLRNVRRLMQQHGLGTRPIWNTEGAPLCQRRDGGRCVIDDLVASEQDALSARAILTMWVNGVEGFAYYTAEGAGGRTLALLSDDYKASTSSAAALRQLAGWMVGARARAVTSWGRAGHAIEAERGTERFVVLWSEQPAEVYAVPAHWRIASAKRLDGGAVAVTGGTLPVGRIPLRVTMD